MKRIMMNRRLLRVLLSFFLLSLLSSPGLAVHAAKLPEAEEQGGKAETVIRVTADEGVKVTVEAEDGSPEPDRSSFTCTGSREKDCFTVRISEPGEYSYTLRVGEKEYKVRISGIYEETDAGEVLCAKAAVSNPDGTKTDEPSVTPFGISDIDKGPALAVLAIVAVLTALGIVMILVKKEEKAR